MSDVFPRHQSSHESSKDLADTDPALVVFSDDWGRHPSSCQHLIGQLLPRFRVYWVNTIGTRPPRFDLLTLSRGAAKIRGWATRERYPVADSGNQNLSILDPVMWPRFHTVPERRLNAVMLERHLRRVLPAGREYIGVTTIPLVADLIEDNLIGRWIYYCVDDLGEWPGLDRRALQEMEKVLASAVDAVVAASPHLVSRMASLGRDATLLTHGVDTGHWQGASGEAIPALDGLEPPLVVFWGVVDRRLHSDWLKILSRRLDAGTILMVGPTNNPDPGLSLLPRLVLEAPIPYDHLPRLASMASVLIMPYADLPATRAMQPLKLKEYLSTNLPVVVSHLPAVEPWRRACDVVTSADGFAEAVIRRLETGLPEDQRAARQGLEDETWSHKASIFEKILLDVGDRTVDRL